MTLGKVGRPGPGCHYAIRTRKGSKPFAIAAFASDIRIGVRRATRPAVEAPESEIDQQVVLDVLGYFSRNPDAVDTLEGVARWRILDERIHQSVEATGRAIAWLVSAGFLSRSSSSSGSLFRLNTEELPNVLKFLEQRSIDTPNDSKETD